MITVKKDNKCISNFSVYITSLIVSMSWRELCTERNISETGDNEVSSTLLCWIPCWITTWTRLKEVQLKHRVQKNSTYNGTESHGLNHLEKPE